MDAAGNERNDIVTVTYYYIQVVNFPDSNLEAAIRAMIGKPTGDITTTDLEGMTNLNASGLGIQSIEGLQYCTNLTELYLNNNQISNISALVGLDKPDLS